MQVMDNVSWAFHCAHTTAQTYGFLDHCTVVFYFYRTGCAGLLADSTADTADVTLLLCFCTFFLIGTFYHNVCGTYVHGIFDKEEVALGLVRAVGIRKGIDVSEMEGVDFAAFKETQYDILASELRKHLDMKKIYEILEQGVEDILEESEAEGEAEK